MGQQPVWWKADGFFFVCINQQGLLQLIMCVVIWKRAFLKVQLEYFSSQVRVRACSVWTVTDFRPKHDKNLFTWK